MHQIATFQNTVGVLVKAYFNGVLECTDCAACACGNLVAAANGYQIAAFGKWLSPNGTPAPDTDWYYVNKLSRGHIRVSSPLATAEGFRQVESTGYTPKQFAQIEDAFMTAQRYDSEGHRLLKEEGNFNGLMAVVEVLADIHQVDLVGTQAAKELFIKA